MKYFVSIFLFLFGGVCLAQETFVLKSKFLKTVDSSLVYKPANYTVGKAYPTGFLLHGHNANFRSWSKLADLQKLADEYNFIVVCPDGLVKSWYINSPSNSGWQFESFFIKELLPEISKKYSVAKDRLFITGASMGGHGAMPLFFGHGDLFRSAGSTSGVLNLRYSGFKKTTIADLLGPYSDDNKAFDEYSVVNLLENIKGSNKEIIFDCGTEDYLYIANKKFREKCDELKIKATYIAQPGAHTGGYWSKTLPVHFKFFADLANR